MSHSVRPRQRRPHRARLAVVILVPALALSAGLARAQQSSVASTVHNLSLTGPGEIRSRTETQICKFCHIPHSAVVPIPLWGHAMSKVRQYEVPEIRTGSGRAIPAPQPDGSSRLCLSCHDGTVALGDVAGVPRIPMVGSQHLTPGRRGFIGTDLSGSHPISFEVPEDHSLGSSGEVDMGVKRRSIIEADPDVRLDGDGKMQCTTCHDPHSDRYFRPGLVPRFWVKPTFEEVCLTCHELL